MELPPMDVGYDLSDPAYAGFAELAHDVVTCRLCPRLVAYREEVARVKRRAFRDETYWGRPVPGFGDPRAELVLVGLAPAAHGANRTGRMFTGDRSGDFLISALYRAGFASQPTSRYAGDGLKLKNAYMTAPVRCAPPKNKPTADEVVACRPFLIREVGLLRSLKVLFALGKIGYDQTRPIIAQLVDAPAKPPPFAHGVIWRPAGDRPPFVVASYHPSQQNTQTGRLTPAMMDDVFATVRRLLVASS